jgi:YegS/Rv2252/BmrU family lipid kinase
MKKKTCLMIYNPRSGKGKVKEKIDIYKKILEDNNFEVDIVATKGVGYATEAVVTADYHDIVFSVGGDGTLNEVVRGNFMRTKKMTICPLPSGTCNDVATMLGYGSDPHKNMELVLNGEVHTMDIGTLNDTPFVYVVGMGKFMNIPYETKSSDKRRAGNLSYVKGGAKQALDQLKRYKTEVEIDGNKMDGYYSLIMISNSDHVAGVSRFHKNVCLDDGELEVLLCKAQTKTKFIKNFLQLFLGRNTDEIISLKARDIKIKLIDKPSKKWCIDGEKYEYNGDTFHIKANKKMNILAPKASVDKLFQEK